QDAKPQGLPESWQYRKRQYGALRAPDAVIVACLDVEFVVTRGHVTVIHHSLRADDHPLTLQPFEPILKAHFLRYGEAQTGVTKFKPLLARRNPQRHNATGVERHPFV